MRKLIILAISLVALAATTVLTLGVGIANASTVSTASDCKPVDARTEYKWVPNVTSAGPTQWTTYNAPAGTEKTFPWKGQDVKYHRDGNKSQFIDSVTCAVSAPIFNLDADTCSVTVPYTPGINTFLYGVNGHPDTEAITSNVTVTGSLTGDPDTAPQFWIGYQAKPGYVISNPGAAPIHFDFYNGDDVRDCIPTATGDVGFEVQLDGGLLTGNVEFAAQGTPTNGTGHLTMTNDWGYSLKGAVTCFNRIDAKTAVFSGNITDATKYATPGYFIAKVIDNGSAGDQIVVFVNEHGNAACSDPANDLPGGDLLADVTSGNLVVQ